MMIVSIIFLARDSTADDPRCTFPIDFSHKGGFNNESDKFHINDLSEMSSPKNKFKFYCKRISKCVADSMI